MESDMDYHRWSGLSLFADVDNVADLAPAAPVLVIGV
jgi:hypothetical protein